MCHNDLRPLPTASAHLLETKAVFNLLKGAGAQGVVYTNSPKKLSNHSKLVYYVVRGGDRKAQARHSGLGGGGGIATQEVAQEVEGGQGRK